ncbi:spore coat protein GerQ [Bacillaceae bacterium S4-13-58]
MTQNGNNPTGAKGTPAYNYPYYTPYPTPGTYPMTPPTFSGGYPTNGVTLSKSQTGIDVPGMLPTEQSYIENILRLNKGKQATVYMTFENNTQWNAKVFKGIIEAAGRDHIILSNPNTGRRYLLLMVYLDYITFDEELQYDITFG